MSQCWALSEPCKRAITSFSQQILVCQKTPAVNWLFFRHGILQEIHITLTEQTLQTWVHGNLVKSVQTGENKPFLEISSQQPKAIQTQWKHQAYGTQERPPFTSQTQSCCLSGGIRIPAVAAQYSHSFEENISRISHWHRVLEAQLPDEISVFTSWYIYLVDPSHAVTDNKRK